MIIITVIKLHYNATAIVKIDSAELLTNQTNIFLGTAAWVMMPILICVHYSFYLRDCARAGRATAPAVSEVVLALAATVLMFGLISGAASAHVRPGGL